MKIHTLFSEDQIRFMSAAIMEAETAAGHKDVPIGAVVVQNNKIIGRGHNQVELLNDPTAHAEIIAISAACAQLGSSKLDNCDIYVTLEPCVMCAGAILLARFKHVYFGAFEPKFGASGSLYNILQEGKYNHKLKVYSGLLEADSRYLLQEFFAEKR